MISCVIKATRRGVLERPLEIFLNHVPRPAMRLSYILFRAAKLGEEKMKNSNQLTVHSIIRRPKTTLLMSALIGVIGSPSLAGQQIVSNTDVALWANAYGGANNGAFVRVVSNCTATNPDCTWHWENGMIVSDHNPALAWNAYGGAINGAFVRIVNNCTATNPDCTWHYNNGMFISDRNPSLVVNAYGGAANGTFLRLVNVCTPVNPDCTFSWGLLTK